MFWKKKAHAIFLIHPCWYNWNVGSFSLAIYGKIVDKLNFSIKAFTADFLQYLHQLFGCPKTNRRPLTMRQPHSTDVNHFALNIYFDSKVTWSLVTWLVPKVRPSISMAFESRAYDFLAQPLNCSFWVTDWTLTFNSKHSKNFL